MQTSYSHVVHKITFTSLIYKNKSFLFTITEHIFAPKKTKSKKPFAKRYTECLNISNRVQNSGRCNFRNPKFPVQTGGMKPDIIKEEKGIRFPSHPIFVSLLRFNA